ncbi:MAG: NeuD/PglB/VioB family sugar acetyltransferase [Planctomycetota bacterium]
MMDVVIFGAGGLGWVVLDILRQAGRYRPVAFLDSDPKKQGGTVDGLPIAGGFEQVTRYVSSGVVHAIVAIGNNHTRVAVARQLKCSGMNLVSAIHPLASISPTARLEEHLIIGPRVVICVHAHVHQHAVLSAGSIVEHDNIVGTGAFLYPAVRLAGTVRVDDLAVLGVGACVIPGRRIGRGARVEPGAVVIRDIPAGAAVTGVPAIPCANTGTSIV